MCEELTKTYYIEAITWLINSISCSFEIYFAVDSPDKRKAKTFEFFDMYGLKPICA